MTMKPNDEQVYKAYLDAYVKAATEDELLGLEDKSIECYAARALGIYDGRGDEIEEPRSLVDLLEAIDQMCDRGEAREDAPDDSAG